MEMVTGIASITEAALPCWTLQNLSVYWNTILNTCQSEVLLNPQFNGSPDISILNISRRISLKGIVWLYRNTKTPSYNVGLFVWLLQLNIITGEQMTENIALEVALKCPVNPD